MGVWETPWLGREETGATESSSYAMLLHQLIRGLGQVGAILSCQVAKTALVPVGQSQPTLGPRGPLGGRWPVLPCLPWEQRFQDSQVIEACKRH